MDEDYRLDQEDYLNEVEKDYRENELPKVMENVMAMRKEISQTERRAMRLEKLNADVSPAKQEYIDSVRSFQKADPNLNHWNRVDMQNKEREYKNIKGSLYAIEGNHEGISMEQISAAKDYPLTKLINSRGGMALCPFHNERHPSFYIKNNFYYCFGCHESGDAIGFVMKKEGLTFKEAVARLNHT